MLPDDTKQGIIDNFTDDEFQLLFGLFDDLRRRSKSHIGIDRDIFVRFCPIPGLWGHCIYNLIRKYSNDDWICFEEFVSALRYLSRSNEEELDKYIFKIFDLDSDENISLEEHIMMLINLPDLGFSSS